MVLKGDVKVNGDKIAKERDFVIFNNEDGDILVESLTEDSLFVVLSGEPINEPIESYGPFVMNTRRL